MGTLALETHRKRCRSHENAINVKAVHHTKSLQACVRLVTYEIVLYAQMAIDSQLRNAWYGMSDTHCN